MPNPLQLWDGSEPVTDALDRLQLRPQFDLAVHDGRRRHAVDLLVAAGVPEVKAVMIIDGVLVESSPESP